MEREQINHTLQQFSSSELTSLCQLIEQSATIERIRKPTAQTMLLPVADPITGGSFYGGEILVTSAITRVNGLNGWSMVMDDNPELADAIAMLDGAWAAEVRKDEITALVNSGIERKRAQELTEQEKVRTTQVSFDLL